MSNRVAQQPAFGTPLQRGGTLARGLNLAMLFNQGFAFYDSARRVRGTYTPANVSLAEGYNRFGKGIDLTTTGANERILIANSGQFVPTSGGTTISVCYEKLDATFRNGAAFGVDIVLKANTFRCQTSIPFTDGVTYFDYGGVTNGTTRVQAAGLTFGADHWVFSTGPRGMEIWQNGQLRASNGANPTRDSLYSDDFVFGKIPTGVGTVSDLARFNMFCLWGRQLTTREIIDLCTNPYAPWELPSLYLSAPAISAAAGGPQPATAQARQGGWFRTQFVPHTGMIVPRPVGVF